MSPIRLDWAFPCFHPDSWLDREELTGGCRLLDWCDKGPTVGGGFGANRIWFRPYRGLNHRQNDLLTEANAIRD
jgi:hypothetical protein